MAIPFDFLETMFLVEFLLRNTISCTHKYICFGYKTPFPHHCPLNEMQCNFKVKNDNRKQIDEVVLRTQNIKEFMFLFVAVCNVHIECVRILYIEHSTL